MKQLENIFQTLKEFDIRKTKEYQDWYDRTKRSADGEINLDFIREVQKENGLTRSEIATLLNVHEGSIKRPLRSAVVLRFCDAYNIPFQHILNTNTGVRPPKIKHHDNLICDGFTLTAYIQFTQDQVNEIVADFQKYLGHTTSELASILRTTYHSLYNEKVSITTFDQLCLAYDLRGSNFKLFLEYLEFKGWFKLKNLLKFSFIQELIAEETNKITIESSILHSMIDSFLLNDEKRPEDVIYTDYVNYSEINPEEQEDLISYFVEDDKYKPFIKKNDFIVTRPLSGDNTVDKIGVYLTATHEQYLSREHSYLWISPQDQQYIVNPPGSPLHPAVTLPYLNFYVLAEIVMIIKADK